MYSTTLDLTHPRKLTAADLIELYLEERTTHPLLLAAAEIAAVAELPSPELEGTFRPQRDAVTTALHAGSIAEAEILATAWVEAVLSPPGRAATALELACALEAFSFVLETRGFHREAAASTVIALRLHALRTHQPFHGTLLRRAAGTLRNLGAIDAAGFLAAEALRLAIEIGDDLGAAYSLAVSAHLAHLAQNWPATLSAAAAARRKLPDGEWSLVFALLNSEISAFICLGRLEEAERQMPTARDVLRRLDSPPLLASFLTWIEARLHMAAGRPEEAARAIQEAEQLGAKTQEPENRILIMLDLSQILSAAGQQDELSGYVRRLKLELPEREKLQGGPAVLAAFDELCRQHGG